MQMDESTSAQDVSLLLQDCCSYTYPDIVLFRLFHQVASDILSSCCPVQSLSLGYGSCRHVSLLTIVAARSICLHVACIVDALFQCGSAMQTYLDLS